MPEKYDQDAHDLCLQLWLQHGGENHELIQAGMRKVYPGWSKSNLYDRGKNGDRMGWITKDGLDRKLKMHLETKVSRVNNDEQALYLGIKAVRERLEKVVQGKPTRDEIYQYRDFCKLEIEARKALDLSRDNLETFVAGYERLLTWLGEIDQAAAKALIKNGEKLVEMAQVHYGKQQDEPIDDGADPREDEGSEPASSGLRLVE